MLKAGLDPRLGHNGKRRSRQYTKPEQIKEKKGMVKVTQMKFRPSKHCPAVSCWLGDFESSKLAGGKSER